MTSNPGTLNWSNTEYHADREYLNNSRRELFRRNPRLFGLWLAGQYHEEPSDSLVIGTAWHTAMLEPEKFADQVGVIPEQRQCTAVTSNGRPCSNLAKVGSDRCGTHKGVESLPNKPILLTRERWELLGEMMAQTWRHSVASVYLDRCGVREQTFVWTCPDSGLKLKCRPDLLSRRHVVDLKSTSDVGPPDDDRPIVRSILRWGYHRQAAFYLRILRGLGVVASDCRWHWIFCENTGPCPRVKVVELDRDDLLLGERQVVRDLVAIADRMARNDWQQDGLGVETVVKLPRYAEEEL